MHKIIGTRRTNSQVKFTVLVCMITFQSYDTSSGASILHGLGVATHKFWAGGRGGSQRVLGVVDGS